ncbi:MAG: hypothetical protein ACRDPY_09705 [Streptosporangiaceae bacterium]
MSDEDVVPVYVTVGVRVSTGEHTPGVVHVPRDEAALLIRERRGVPGERAPKGYEDGGVDLRAVGIMMSRLAPADGSG